MKVTPPRHPLFALVYGVAYLVTTAVCVLLLEWLPVPYAIILLGFLLVGVIVFARRRYGQSPTQDAEKLQETIHQEKATAKAKKM